MTSEPAPSPSTRSTAAAVEVGPAATFESGKMTILAAYAVAASALPIPILPDRVVGRVRGAMVHDISARYGVSLTSDARDALASPDSADRTRLAKVAETIVRQLLRRVGPLGAMSSVSRGLEVYALGLCLERYVRNVRSKGSVRMQIHEARLLREAIDRSILRAFSPTLRPQLTTVAGSTEDLRDEFTRWIDTFFLTTAALPGYVRRRLESAFDEVVSETPGLGDG